MIIIYNFLLKIYRLAIGITSLWKPKAKLWIEGRKNILNQISSDLESNERRVWFHCASLGEFEQGRPIIEAFRLQHPAFKIVMTFFSPSGYEIRKKYEGADYIYYLPLDSKNDSKRFIDLIKPELAVFIKYEFWYYYLTYLNVKNIPVIFVSSIFRSNQLFFKEYGKFYRNMLQNVSHFFVQNITSAELLKNIQIKNVTVSGDTRFDRVISIVRNKKTIPYLNAFKGNHKIIIAGSSWPQDEKIVSEYFNSVKGSDFKLIIVPHEIGTSHIDAILSYFSPKSSIKYSSLNEENAKEAKTLIIDNIGMLSSLYQYAEIAFIGGGFGAGIHNTLEAATYGLPIIIGPNFSKFQEARDLIETGGAFCIENTTEFDQIIQKLKDQETYKKASETCKNYVEKNQGASNIIMSYINTLLKK